MNEDDKIAYKQIIMDFINSEDESMDLMFHPLNDFSKVLAEIGFNTQSGGSINLAHNGNKWDTNGWQVDFWWTIHREGKKYMIAGSLFYGNMKLSKDDSEDDDDE